MPAVIKEVPKTIPTLTALRATLGAAGAAILLIGRSSAFDGGEGYFVWTTDASAADNGATVVVPTVSGWTRTGCWKRVIDEVINVKWFGAKGDGSTIDTTTIQAGIGAAAQLLKPLYFPPGDYVIDDMISIKNDTASGNQAGVKLLGASTRNDGPFTGRSCLIWNGASTTTPMLAIWSRGCTVQDMHFTVAAGKTAICAIDCTLSNGAGAINNTANVFRNLRIAKEGGSGDFTYGIKIADKIGAGAYPPNCEFFTFEKVFIENIVSKCVYCPNTTGQSKSHVFRECSFLFSQVGVEFATGSWYMDKTNISYCSDSAIVLGSPTDVIVVRDMNSEQCNRFLKSTGGGGDSWPIVIDGGRFDNSNVNADGRYIDHANGRGPITLKHVIFESVDSNFKIRCGNGADLASMSIVAIGCSFPNTNPFEANQQQRIIILGCNALSGGGATAMDDQIFGRGTSSLGNPSRERLRIGSAYITNNTTGTVTISGASTSASVTFGVAEPNTSYQVITGIDSISGAFTPGAPYVSNKTTSGFTINMPAPGGGNSATVAWWLVRTS